MYQVRLSVGSHVQTAPLEVRLDPRATASAADLQRQLDLLLQIRESVNQAHDAVNQMRDLRAQLAALQRRMGADPKAKAIVAAAGALDKRMTPIEEEMLQVKSKSSQDPLNYPIMLNDKLMALAGVVESADAAPTQQSYDVYAYLKGKLDPLVARWKEAQAKDLAALNELIRRENVPLLGVMAPRP
jgi:hypothetical protein